MKKGGGGDNRRGGGKRNRNEKPIAENEEQNKKAQAQSAEGDEGSNDHSGGRAKQKKGGKKKGRNMLKFEARQNRAAQLHTTTSLAEGGSVTMDIDGHPHLLIDGAYKEGGGQVLRNTFSLSALLGRPIKAFNIRANRNRPGLMAQHLTGIRLVAEMFDGWLDGAEVRFFL
jgi:hypothetical protein